MIVPVSAFNTFSGNYEEAPAAVALKESFLSSAEEIVKDYLHYDPSETTYTGVYLNGSGMAVQYLPAMPVSEVTSLTVNGCSVDLSKVLLEKDRIRRTDGIFPSGTDNVVISYKAGWSEENLPKMIAESILRIATLMLQEMGGNIGLSGKSFSDMSRTFVSYTNYEKYLQPLAGLKVVKF